MTLKSRLKNINKKRQEHLFDKEGNDIIRNKIDADFNYGDFAIIKIIEGGCLYVKNNCQ